MATQAASTVNRWITITAAWIGYLGAMSAAVLIMAFVFMPVGHLIWDYWSPRVQSVWQQPAASQAQQQAAKKGKP